MKKNFLTIIQLAVMGIVLTTMSCRNSKLPK